MALSAKYLSFLVLLSLTFVCHISAFDESTFEAVSEPVCPGDEVTFNCTVFGMGSTTWIINTTSPCEFVHGSGGTEDTSCSPFRAVIGPPEGPGNNCYPSNLTVTASPTVDNSFIQCFGPNFLMTEVGNTTLTLRDPPPLVPLTAFNCTISGDVEDAVRLNLSDWDSSFTNEYGVEMYCVSSMEASCNGTCVSPNEDLVQCTGLVVDQTFTFRVSAVNCGNQTGPESNSITVTPQVPQAPNVTIVSLEYNDMGFLQSITTTWTNEVLTIVTPSSVCEVSPPTPPSGCAIPGDFQESDVLYYITYEPDQGDVDISCPVSCNSSECMDVFDEFHNGNSSYTVTVSASNVVGIANTTVFNISMTNNLLSVGPVNVTSSSEATVDCQFLSGFSGMSRCTAECGTDPTFTNLQLWGQSNESDPGTAGDTRVIPLQPPELLTLNTPYFCIISARTGDVVKVEVQAQFTTPAILNCDPDDLGGTVDSSTDSRCDGALEGSNISSASIDNGVICFNGTTGSTSVALYMCDDGTSNRRECQDNGTYSGNEITCVGNCDPDDLGGTVDSSTDSRCDGALEGSNISSASIDNGVICFNGTTGLTSVALYICDDGTSNRRECQVNGTYSGNEFICLPVSADDEDNIIIIIVVILVIVVIATIVLNLNLILIDIYRPEPPREPPCKVWVTIILVLVVVTIPYVIYLYCCRCKRRDEKPSKEPPCKTWVTIILVLVIVTIPFVIYLYCCRDSQSGGEDDVDTELAARSTTRDTGATKPEKKGKKKKKEKQVQPAEEVEYSRLARPGVISPHSPQEAGDEYGKLNLAQVGEPGGEEYSQLRHKGTRQPQALPNPEDPMYSHL